MSDRVLVVSIGNRLVGDDAVGPTIHDELINQNLPDDVVLKLLGVGGIDILDALSGQEHLIVIDAVRWGTPPGSVHVTTAAPLKDTNGMPVTSHDIGLKDVLEVADCLFPENVPKKTTFIGIEGENFDELGSPLSESVKAAVPQVVNLVLSIL